MSQSLKLSQWGEKGYARAMAVCTDSKSQVEYPTQDKHTPAEEEEFIQGFNLGMADYKEHGFRTVEAYGQEGKDQ